MEKEIFKVLLVDDEPEINELLSYNFRKRGFEVQTAGNGYTGFAALETFTPDVIILDIMMPYVNGINMCREIKSNERYKDIPILFLSATSNEEIINKAMDAGGTRFLSKPIHMGLLIDIVTQMKHQSDGTSRDSV